MIWGFDDSASDPPSGGEAQEVDKARAAARPPRPPAARSPPRPVGVPVAVAAGLAAEDLKLVEKISAGAVERFGEGPSDELRQQLLANLRGRRVDLLGGAWTAVERHPPWRRAEFRRVHGQGAAGDGARTPEPGERVIVRLRACMPDPAGAPGIFLPLPASQESLDCILGDGCLPEGVEKALPRVGVGQTVEVRCIGEACLRDWPAEGLEHLPPEGYLVWQVQLARIVSVGGLDDPKCYTNHFVADVKQRLARANELRERGNALLKAGRIAKAVEVYEAGECFTSIHEPEDPRGLAAPGGQADSPPLFGDPSEVNRRMREARKPLLLNRALALQKQGDWRLSADVCTEVLKSLDPECVKALLRRGKSRVRLKEFHGATEDLLLAQRLDESVEPQARKELALLKRLEKQAHMRLLGASPSGSLQTALSRERAGTQRPRGQSRTSWAQGADGGACSAGGGSSATAPSAVDPPPREQSGAERGADGGLGTSPNPGDVARAAFVRGRVSVICPTTARRHDRLPQLYVCFLLQDVEDKELVVVDTGPGPSHFFGRLHDERVKYRHVPGPEDSMTIGAKRNCALHMASGEFVAHFDDDDLYAPPYLGGMLQVLQKGDAHVCKLAAWHVLDTETCVCGHYDGAARLPRPFESSREQDILAGGYGFSLVYRRELSARFGGFGDVSWGEDVHFVNAAKAAGVRTVFLRDTEFVCLHVQHGQNLSRSIAQSLVAPRTWLAFLRQLSHMAEALLGCLQGSGPREHMPRDLRDVRLLGHWDPSRVLAPDVRAAFARGAAQLKSPGPASPPLGLLVCSLYDEYYTCAKEDSQQTDPGPELLDPLERWRGSPQQGMTAWPSGRAGFVPSPLKPMESVGCSDARP
uniref:peptidylprolyl isomerase n=1 Tax=Alexandrium monilatum TaxID=311494 RepID=A0A7S4RSS9_9DINO